LEVTAKNVDRLVTTEMRWGSRGDRGIGLPPKRIPHPMLELKTV